MIQCKIYNFKSAFEENGLQEYRFNVIYILLYGDKISLLNNIFTYIYLYFYKNK